VEEGAGNTGRLFCPHFPPPPPHARPRRPPRAPNKSSWLFAMFSIREARSGPTVATYDRYSDRDTYPKYVLPR